VSVFVEVDHGYLKQSLERLLSVTGLSNSSNVVYEAAALFGIIEKGQRRIVYAPSSTKRCRERRRRRQNGVSVSAKGKAVLDVIATIADSLADFDYSGAHIPHLLPPYILCTSSNMEAL
jgi:hypothetical protein